MKFLIPTICGLIMAAGCSSQSRPAVVKDAPQSIYVDGEINHHGEFAWTNGMRLQDAIEAAGGFTDFSDRRVRLRHWDGSVEVYRLGHGYNLTNNPLLRPGDKIYNPRHDFP